METDRTARQREANTATSDTKLIYHCSLRGRIGARKTQSGRAKKIPNATRHIASASIAQQHHAAPKPLATVQVTQYARTMAQNR